jgi:hypothetical protein
MVLRVSDPVLMRELLAFLESRPEAVAVQVSEDEIEVGGSVPPSPSPCPWPAREPRRWDVDRARCRWRC